MVNVLTLFDGFDNLGPIFLAMTDEPNLLLTGWSVARQRDAVPDMGAKNIYERFIWFDHQVRGKKYPNASSLAVKFEISTKTAQRDIDFMRDRLQCPLEYDSGQKGYYYRDGTFPLPMVYLSSSPSSLPENCSRTSATGTLVRNSSPSQGKSPMF